MRVLPAFTAYWKKAAVSCTGMPSVMTTQSGICASTASTTASLVKAGGTKTTDTSAAVSFIASPTVAKTGRLVPSKSTCWPALRGLTPPTTWVPEASIRRVCLLPSEPVIPWTTTLLSFVSQMAMCVVPSLLRCQLGGPPGRAVHRVDHLDDVVLRLVEDPPALVGVVAVKAYDEGLADRVAP